MKFSPTEFNKQKSFVMKTLSQFENDGMSIND
jgi:hypothetical protein